MYKKGVSEEEGGEEGRRWSVLQKSGHLPQLINYNPPWKTGAGGMTRLRVRPGGGRAVVRVALAHLVERWPENEDPLGGGGGLGEIQQPLAGGMQAPWDFTL